MERVIKENMNLRKKIVSAMKRNFSFTPGKLPSTSEFLKAVLQSAITNAGKDPHGYRYPEPLKAMCAHLYTLTGLQAYEILWANLLPAIPSVSNVKRHLYSSGIIREGEFRVKALKKFLQDRNLPLKVWLSEDGTRIIARIQYDISTNQIIGFVLDLDENGLPIVGSHPATSASLIKSYFAEKKTANYAYAIMAQPLAKNAPPFCLTLFATDNKFTADTVKRRWKWMERALMEEGIEVVGTSADGDPRLLRAMLDCALPSAPPSHQALQFKDSFVFDLDAQPIMLQDTIHIITKLKSRLLKPSIILPMGKVCCASRGHIAELIKNFTKDQHNLCMSVLKSKDKMNFKSAERLCSKIVTEMLEINVPGSEATVTYLEMMRSIIDSHCDTKMSPSQRVSLMWEWVFFLRLWKKWIEEEPGYTLAHNFLTSNTYQCIELNAHAAIKMLRKCRDTEQPELFLTWLLGSQQCERFFRAARSMTGSYSTMVNFSFLELLHRLRRIEKQLETCLTLGGTFNFPRAKPVLGGAPDFPVLPEDYEIQSLLQESKKRAIKRAAKLGICKSTTKVIPVPVFQMTSPVLEEESDDEWEEENPDYSNGNESSDEESEESSENEEDLIDDTPDVEEDIAIVSSGALGVKSIEKTVLTPTSPFVKVEDASGKTSIIRKSTLCWLLSTGDLSLSADRCVRVAAADTNHQESLKFLRPQVPGIARKEDHIDIGDWCAFKSENGSLIIGMVLAFSYLSGSSWSQQEYSHISAPTEAPKQNARGLGCMCTWYTVKKKMLKPINMDTHGYYDITNYLFTISRPKRQGKDLFLTCNLKV